jgi:hypothetical protein
LENAAQRTVIVGQEANAAILDNTEISQTFPVIRTHTMWERMMDSNTGEYVPSIE